MAKITPDFESQTAKPGTYVARLISCENKVSKQGNNYLNWKLDLGNGQWVFLSTGLRGKGAVVLQKLVQAAKDPKYEGGEIETDEILGHFVTVKCDFGINTDGTQSKYLSVTEISRCENPPVSSKDFDDDLPF